MVSQKVENKEIDEVFVRKMLGIADKSKVLNLLQHIFEGDQNKSLAQLKELVDEGLDPIIFLNELLEIVYFIQQKKNIGKFESDLFISPEEEKCIDTNCILASCFKGFRRTVYCV